MPPLLAVTSPSCAANVVGHDVGKASMVSDTQHGVRGAVPAKKSCGGKLGGMLMPIPSFCGAMVL